MLEYPERHPEPRGDAGKGGRDGVRMALREWLVARQGKARQGMVCEAKRRGLVGKGGQLGGAGEDRLFWNWLNFLGCCSVGHRRGLGGWGGREMGLMGDIASFLFKIKRLKRVKRVFVDSSNIWNS